MTFFFYLIYRKDSVSAGETAIAICVLKEIFDLTIKQSFFSYQDLLADFVGILLLVLLVGIRRTKRVNV